VAGERACEPVAGGRVDQVLEIEMPVLDVDARRRDRVGLDESDHMPLLTAS
jgi:hypothetical protein